MSTAIKFENISKQYRLGLVSTRTISHDLNRWWQTSVRGKEDPYLKIGEVNDRATKGTSEYVWALRDINFEVQQGDVLGIIGKNGAGKSTLLKILSKVTAPTTGIIKARGRIASLLEVGTGFHPEMTGRENIFMNGAIMGMTKAEIKRKLDEIVDFSGVERYLDTPAKRYSSGMTVRLGFAIAAHLDPEILVVDEVLAVGDAEFQKKAIGKMQDVSKGEGRTVLFVSHDLKAVSAFCRSGLLLQDGMVAHYGTISETIRQYAISRNRMCGTVHIDTQCVEFRGIDNPEQLNNLFVNSDSIEIYLRFYCNKIKGKKLFFDFGIYNGRNEMVIHTKTKYVNSKPFQFEDKQEVTLTICINNPSLSPGTYNLTIYVYEEESEEKVLLWIDDIPLCNVSSDNPYSLLEYNYLAEVKSVIFPKISIFPKK